MNPAINTDARDDECNVAQNELQYIHAFINKTEAAYIELVNRFPIGECEPFNGLIKDAIMDSLHARIIAIKSTIGD